MDEENNNSGQNAGWVFTPGQTTATPPAANNPAPITPSNPVINPITTPESPALNDASSAINTPHASTLLEPQQQGRVSWTSSEYIAHPKNHGWFTILGVGTFLATVLVYLMTKDIVSVVAITILGITVGVFAARQPRELSYTLDSSGITIGPRYYEFGSFKSFSVVPDGAFNFISLVPLKRFMPPIAIHFAPENEDKILETLGDFLPYEEHKNDIVENISRRARF